MKVYVKLNRSVMRGSTACNWCRYEIVPFDEVYAPVIGGVELALFCSRRCASKSMTAPLEVAYL